MANRDLERRHCAKYLVLCGTAASPRALLFDGHHRYLAEMIDAGLTLERLERAGRRCVVPAALTLDGVRVEWPGERLRCFELD